MRLKHRFIYRDGVRRILILLAVVAVACGGVASDTTENPNGSDTAEPTTSQPETTTTAGEPDDPGTTDSPVTTQAEDDGNSPTADLPAAPDFTLELGTGGEYTLSSTDNPVYMIFWAEW